VKLKMKLIQLCLVSETECLAVASKTLPNIYLKFAHTYD
jgi:hypothetical protein